MFEILHRGNDLEEFFWPIIYFVKQQILQNHTLPLWNNMIFAGTPLLPDPQSSLFYLPNIIFLMMPIDSGFLVSIFLHIVFGAVGIYLCSRKIFNFSKTSSLLTAVMFCLNPKLAGFLEAGHFGLMTSFAWLPYVLFATLKIANSQQFRWIILLSISLAAMFYTHLLIFLITFSLTTVTSIFVIIQKRKIFLVKLFSLSLIFTFGLIAIQFLPQLEWKDQTSRLLLLQDRDVYPKWTGLKEFLINSLVPWMYGVKYIQSIDSEKWLALGLFPTLLSVYGFFYLKKNLKLALSILSFITVLISLNNASPLYPLLMKFDPFVLLRIATRVWFVMVLAVIVLSGFGFDLLQKRLPKISVIFALAVVVELSFLSSTYLLKSISNAKLAPEEVYQYLKSDNDLFRVYCTIRCLSQKKSTEYGLELLDGYNTLQQKNFYRQSWQLMGGYWNYYTLSIPPIGTYTFEKLQPDPISLGAYNVKYVISPYTLTNENFILKKQFGEYLLYENVLNLSRAYFFSSDQKPILGAKILTYSPNYIKVDTTNKSSLKLVLSEVYSPGWKAYLNENKEVSVQQKPDALSLVDLKEDTRFVDFKYEPDSYNLGKTITATTLAILIISSLVIIWKKRF